MTIFDLVLLLLLFGFAWFGFWFGLIYSLGGLIGMVAGAILASRWYDIVAVRLSFLFGDHANLAKVVCFIVLFLLIWRIIAWLVSLINKLFNLPFIRPINQLFGGLFGLLEGGLVLGLILYFVTKFPIGSWDKIIANSQVAQALLKVARILWPLLPVALKQIQGFIN